MSFSKYRRVLQKTLWELSARSRASAAGARLAPGRLTVLDKDPRQDQGFLMERAREFGPVFKVWMPHKLTTCIVGLALARRFLTEHEDNIGVATPDLSLLFPHGFLRGLEGEPHKIYRKRFAKAFRATPIEIHDPLVLQAIRRCFASIADAPQPVAGPTIRSHFKALTTELMLWFVLGVELGSELSRRLAADCAAYAPDGAFLVVRKRHRQAYRAIRDLVAGHAQTLKEGHPSLLGHFVRAQNLDETVLGNLIQMVVVGSYDLHGLCMWLLKHMGDNPETADLARSHPAGCAGAVRPAWAIPRETLRMEQSELLLRVATRDIVFDGFFIPKDSHIRICVWEAHHDPRVFEQPFQHDCRRFMAGRVSPSDYAPFGLDKHRCLGADWSYILGEIFVEELVTGFRLQIVDDGPPEFGRFHFQPSSRLASCVQEGLVGEAETDLLGCRLASSRIGGDVRF
ncbi:MAG: cytochrome P450 [Mesorhizobium sp.]